MNIYTANCVHRVTKKFETIHILAKDQNHATELLRTTHYRILFAKSYARNDYTDNAKTREQIRLYTVTLSGTQQEVSKPAFVRANPDLFTGSKNLINAILKNMFTDKSPRYSAFLNKD